MVDNRGQAVYKQAGFPIIQQIVERVNSLLASSQIE